MPQQQRPVIPNLAVRDEVADYLWKKSLESNFSYELLLAIAMQESHFNESLIVSSDYGLMQVNRNTAKWIATQLNRPNYNLLDYRTNIDFAVYYLSYLRQTWDNYGISRENLTSRVILSYNRGINGAKNYIQHHWQDSPYVYNVKHYKTQFENR
jgi:membrane-bound lytic murein transglycosylase MltF